MLFRASATPWQARYETWAWRINAVRQGVSSQVPEYGVLPNLEILEEVLKGAGRSLLMCSFCGNVLARVTRASQEERGTERRHLNDTAAAGCPRCHSKLLYHKAKCTRRSWRASRQARADSIFKSSHTSPAHTRVSSATTRWMASRLADSENDAQMQEYVIAFMLVC